MVRGLSGRYEVISSTGEEVRAFLPSPLPPVPELEMTQERQRLLERAHLACGRLDGVSALLPEASLFLYAYVRREAVLSSQIEGTQSSLSDLLLFELEDAPGVPFDDVIEVSNYVAAMEHGLARLAEGCPLSNRLIREIHEKLMSKGRGASKQPGEFRRSQNWIGGTRPGNARFVPPPPHRVAECMAALEKFLHDDQMPTLVKAALAHVQFETIHPFLDGNGRTGRLLIALMLHHDGILRQPLLYLSLYLKTHRAEYYRLLEDVRLRGEWGAWLDFVLEGMTATATGAVETAHNLLALFESDERKLRESGKGTRNALRVFAELRRRPLINIENIIRSTSMSFPTANRSIQTLTNLGITREVTGRQRQRVFAYDAYLAILNEGTES